CFGPSDGLDKLLCQRRNAGHAPEKIKRSSLSGEKSPGRSRQLSKDAASYNHRALVDMWLEPDSVIEQVQYLFRNVKSRNHSILLCDDQTLQSRFNRYDTVGRHIAGTDVLLQCSLDV